MSATFDEFVVSLIANGERSGWTSQNGTSGAYGKFQITPLNWRDWSCRALATLAHPWIMAQLALGRKTVADRTTPPEQWWPHVTVGNQTDTARWRLAQMAVTHGNDWQAVAGAWESGNGNPDQWTDRTRKYIDRVCVPLGYAALPLPVASP